jgi:hypothetical protein
MKRSKSTEEQLAYKRKQETRLLRHNVLTEVSNQSRALGVDTQAQLTLQVVNALDESDEWWESKEKWSLATWLEWARQQLATFQEEAFQSHKEPTVGYSLRVSAGRRGSTE